MLGSLAALISKRAWLYTRSLGHLPRIYIAYQLIIMIHNNTEHNTPTYSRIGEKKSAKIRIS